MSFSLISNDISSSKLPVTGPVVAELTNNSHRLICVRTGLGIARVRMELCAQSGQVYVAETDRYIASPISKQTILDDSVTILPAESYECGLELSPLVTLVLRDIPTGKQTGLWKMRVGITVTYPKLTRKTLAHPSHVPFAGELWTQWYAVKMDGQ